MLVGATYYYVISLVVILPCAVYAFSFTKLLLHVLLISNQVTKPRTVYQATRDGILSSTDVNVYPVQYGDEAYTMTKAMEDGRRSRRKWRVF